MKSKLNPIWWQPRTWTHHATYLSHWDNWEEISRGRKSNSSLYWQLLSSFRELGLWNIFELNQTITIHCHSFSWCPLSVLCLPKSITSMFHAKIQQKHFIWFWNGPKNVSWFMNILPLTRECWQDVVGGFQAACGLCAWPAPPPIYQRLVIVKFGFGCQLAGQQHYSSLPLCTRAPERPHQHSPQTLFLPTFPSYPSSFHNLNLLSKGRCTMLRHPRQNSLKTYSSPPKRRKENKGQELYVWFDELFTGM